MTGQAVDAAAPRVGLFGLLGSGNSGNDASMETVLAYLREAHPDAVVDALCGGPERVRASTASTPPRCTGTRDSTSGKPATQAAFLKLLGKGIDTVPHRVLGAAARRGDRVRRRGARDHAAAARVGVPVRAVRARRVREALRDESRAGQRGGRPHQQASDPVAVERDRTARLLPLLPGLVLTRRDAAAGIDTSSDRVYPDLVFGVPTPPYEPGDPRLVGVGVMAYYGGNDDRKQGGPDPFPLRRDHDAFHPSGWSTTATGCGCSVGTASSTAKSPRRSRRTCASTGPSEPSRVTIASGSTYPELIREMAPVGMVVATRYHNVMCALKLCKPTISLGYSRKFISLMTDMGLAEFHQYAGALDLERLIEQFKELESRRASSSRRWLIAMRPIYGVSRSSSPCCPRCSFPQANHKRVLTETAGAS